MEKKQQEILLDEINLEKNNYHKLITKWLNQLRLYKNPELKFITKNSEILDLKYDNKNYSVTDNDVGRTRTTESVNFPNYKKTIISFLLRKKQYKI